MNRKIDREKVKDLLFKGFTDAEVAEILDCSPITITTIRTRELDLIKNSYPPGTRIIDNEARKLLAKLIQKVRIEFGLSRKEIADILEVGKQTVNNLIIEHNEENY